MHLVTCACPQEPLEQAPRSALVADHSDEGEWDAFWSLESDEYLVRCTRAGGDVQGFRVEDDVDSAAARPESRVLEFRRPNYGRTAVIVAESPSGRRMLVGSARRGGGTR